MTHCHFASVTASSLHACYASNVLTHVLSHRGEQVLYLLGPFTRTLTDITVCIRHNAAHVDVLMEGHIKVLLHPVSSLQWLQGVTALKNEHRHSDMCVLSVQICATSKESV